MAQTSINIRIDSAVKQEAEQLFESLGMNMSTAFNIFVRQSLRTGGIPFKITSIDSGFFNQYNQKKLREAAVRMNQGRGIAHELMDDHND